MRKLLTIATLCIMTLVLMTSSEKQFTIFMIGDSTMSNKDIVKTPHERGWGMALQGFFTDNVKIDNRAINGRSSKSFIEEGRWKFVVDDMKPGDYLVIQFGHNDEKKDKKGENRHTEAGLDFADNYRMFIRTAIGKGVTPIVMNAVARRNFKKVKQDDIDDEALRDAKASADDVQEDAQKMVDTHGAYAVVPRNVARDMNVPFVDATKITTDLENHMGADGSKRLHMISVGKNSKDNTHYTEYGAHEVASLLVDEMAKVCPELKPYVRHYDYVVSTKGFGNYMTLQAAVNIVPIYSKSTILVLDGTWKKPNITSGKKITFVCYPGAQVN